MLVGLGRAWTTSLSLQPWRTWRRGVARVENSPTTTHWPVRLTLKATSWGHTVLADGRRLSPPGYPLGHGGRRSLSTGPGRRGASCRIWSLLGWSGFARRKRNGVASTTCAASTAGLSWAGQAGLWLRTLPWHRRRPGGLYGETSHTQLARWQLGSVGSLTCARRAWRVLLSGRHRGAPVRYNGQRQVDGYG